MGVDVNAVSGFTVRISQDVIDSNIARYNCEDIDELYDVLDIPSVYTGSQYSGEVELIPILHEPTPIEVDRQIAEWLGNINAKLGTELRLEDVSFISELYWY